MPAPLGFVEAGACGPVIETDALGITAPVESLTVPVRVARSTCAWASPAAPSTDRTQITISSRFMSRSYELRVFCNLEAIRDGAVTLVRRRTTWGGQVPGDGRKLL